MRLVSRNVRVLRWVWIGGLGLGLVAITVVVILWNTTDRTPTLVSEPQASDSSDVVSSSLSTTDSSDTAVLTQSLLPRLDFPPGSVEEACGLNDFPSRVVFYSGYDDDERRSLGNYPFNAQGNWIALESEKCWAALEVHTGTTNPYLWGITYENRSFLGQLMEFVVLAEPLTFERIFPDPSGDFVRVQDALSRPECLLEPGEKNWELKVSCHADAFLNYALINRFCFGVGVSDRNRNYFWAEDNPTPEQDRFMWKQALEDDWVRLKCEELDRTLKFTSEQYPDLYDSVISQKYSASERKKDAQELLVELAARLGDDAAGLARVEGGSASPSYGLRHQIGSWEDIDDEHGYKYGRFVKQLNMYPGWRDIVRKDEPSTNHFLRTFHMLARIASPKMDYRDVIQFDWDWVVQHLCKPPYVDRFHEPVTDPTKSCQQVVHEIRQQNITLRPLLDVLDKFEQVALELELYE